MLSANDLEGALGYVDSWDGDMITAAIANPDTGVLEKADTDPAR